MESVQAAKPRIEPYGRHVLMCVGPRCAPPGVALEVYGRLKDLLKSRGLKEGPSQVRRAKCHCLHVCEGGPILVVHPEGVWYAGVTKEALETIFEEHIVGGRPVEEYVIHQADGAPREGS